MLKLRDILYYGLMCIGIGGIIYLALTVKGLARIFEQWVNQR